VLKLAQGLEAALKADPLIREGVNVYRGSVTYLPVAQAHNLQYRPLDELLQTA
jgi:alanine dehydrogenase